MRRSEWLVRAALVFCLLYGLVAVADRGNEAFPFFAWDLFSSVPNPHGADFSARILEADRFSGKLPVYFEDAGLQDSAREIQGYAALQALGQALERGDEVTAAALRKSFESAYLSALPRVRYEIVKRTYDVRRRVQCRSCFTGETVIARYARG